jgi:hypothetical protein
MTKDSAVLLAPALVRRMFVGKPVAGARSQTTDVGVTWRPAVTATIPLIVVFSAEPRSLAWISSSLASALPAVVVIAASLDHPADTLAAAQAIAADLGADAGRVGIIGEGDAAAAALEAATVSAPTTSTSADRTVDRVALISPHSLPPDPAESTPPTLLQFTQGGSSATEADAWERRVKQSGVAVRSIDYIAVGDGWVRYPRAIRGSRRAHTDLLAFFRRGLGDDSTFHVIPGWDLH